MGVPQNGWFIMENPIIVKMDDLEVPPFQETSIFFPLVPSRNDSSRPVAGLTATRTLWADQRRGDSWPSHPCVAQRALLAVTLW